MKKNQVELLENKNIQKKGKQQNELEIAERFSQNAVQNRMYEEMFRNMEKTASLPGCLYIFQKKIKDINDKGEEKFTNLQVGNRVR